MIESITKNAKRLTVRLALSAALVIGVSAVGSLGATHAAEKEKQQISRVIAKEMIAAQKAIQAQQWAEAIKNLDEAETKSGLTPFDKSQIYYLKGYAYSKMNNPKGAQQAFEQSMQTGAATPEEQSNMIRSLFAIAANGQQYQKAIDYGKQLIDSGTAMLDAYVIIAQSYFQLKNCKDSVIWSDKGIAATRKAGETPKENLYLFKLQCASDAGDNVAMAAVLYDLIRVTNSSKYWNTLLRIERQDERDDHNTLMIYRIMYNTNAMNADTDYIEMAQLLGDSALPGEAESVLEKAMGNGTIKDEHKERTTRLIASLKTRAEADRKGLPQQEAEASKSSSGQLSVALGEVYYGFGDYQKAVDAINQGVQKGQFRHLDDAYVYSGLAEVQLKNKEEARKAFAKLKDVPNISPRILKLYELYAATI
jgi:tetratricopeptide (TPR) repeat protein